MAEPQSTMEFLAIQDIVAVLRRQWFIVAAALLVTFGAGVAFTALQPRVYGAEASVLIRTNTNQQLFPLSEAAGTRLTRTVIAELEYTKTDLFRAQAAASTGNDIDVRTSSPEESNTLVFRAEGPEPESTANAANAWAQTYVSARHELHEGELDASIELLDSAIGELVSQRDQLLAPLIPLDDALASPSLSIDELTLLNSQRFAVLQSLNDELAPIEGELSQLQTRRGTLAVDRQFVADPEASARSARAAVASNRPVEPHWVRNLLYSALAAAGVAAAAASLVESLTDRLRNQETVAQASRLPILGELPHLASSDPPAVLETLGSADSGFFEAMQSVVTSIQLIDRDDLNEVILVSSAAPNAGKSTVAAALVTLFAGNGERVALLDADMRKPTVHEIFDLANRRGLSNYLEGTVDVGDVIFNPPGGEVVDVIPAGPPTTEAINLLRTERFRTLISELRTKYDRVIIDAPPVLPVADPIEIARMADAAVFVARLGSSKATAVQRSVPMLQATGVRILGVIANDSNHASNRYGHYAR